MPPRTSPELQQKTYVCFLPQDANLRKRKSTQSTLAPVSFNFPVPSPQPPGGSPLTAILGVERTGQEIQGQGWATYRYASACHFGRLLGIYTADHWALGQLQPTIKSWDRLPTAQVFK
jgi:hypothetical protein